MHDKKIFEEKFLKEFCTRFLKIISYVMVNAATGYSLSRLTLCICQPTTLEQKT